MEKWDGVWVFRENWYLKYFWGANFWYLLAVLWDKNKATDFLLTPFLGPFMGGGRTKLLNRGPNYPKNLCHLVMGALGSLLWVPIIFCLTLAVGLVAYGGIIVFAGVIIVFVSVPAFCGFYPDMTESKKAFCPYKWWGNKRISVALWEVCLPMLTLYLIFSNLSGILAGASSAITFTITKVTSNSVVFLSTLGGLLIIFVLGFLFTTNPGELVLDYMRAKKAKVCPKVVVVRKK